MLQKSPTIINEPMFLDETGVPGENRVMENMQTNQGLHSVRTDDDYINVICLSAAPSSGQHSAQQMSKC